MPAHRALTGLLLWLGAGLVTGVGARVFMRTVTTDPEFSWSGTAFIVGGFGVAGVVLGAVAFARGRAASPWWRLSSAPCVVLLLGPGVLLVPTALACGLAQSRRGTPVVRRIASLAAVGAATPVVVLGRTPADVVDLLVPVPSLVLVVMAMGRGVAEVVRPWPTRGAHA